MDGWLGLGSMGAEEVQPIFAALGWRRLHAHDPNVINDDQLLETVERIVEANPQCLLEKCRLDEGTGGRAILPVLHYALRFNAPVNVIRYLLRGRPEAAREWSYAQSSEAAAADDDDEHTTRQRRRLLLPLHVACQYEELSGDDELEEAYTNKKAETVRAVLEAWPQAVQETAESNSSGKGFPLDQIVAWAVPRLDVLKCFVGAWPDAIQEAYANGSFPLHELVRNGAHKSIVHYVVEKFPPSIRAANAQTQTALHMIRDTTKLETVRAVVTRWSGSTKARDCRGWIPLVQAVQVGPSLRSTTECLEIVKFLVQQDPASLKEKDNFGRVSLHWAAGYDPNIVRFLLRSWPESIRERDTDGNLPVHTVADPGRVESYNDLLEAWPASIHERSSGGRLPLHDAARSGKLEVIRYFVGKWPESVRELTLVDGGDGGQLPLHAVLRGDLWSRISQAQILESAQFLLQRFPDSIFTLTDEGELPLHIAADCPLYVSSDIIRFLVRSGPLSVRVATNRGMLPVQCAVRTGKALPVVQLLLDEWRDSIGFKTVEEGDSLLHLALAAPERRPSMEVVQHLLDRRPHLCREPNLDGSLPLHVALSSGTTTPDLALVRSLVERHPSSLLTADARGSIPLHMALSSGTPTPDLAIIRFLVERHPPSLLTADARESIPLHVALSSGATPNLAVVRFLVEEQTCTVQRKDAKGVASVADRGGERCRSVGDRVLPAVQSPGVTLYQV
jgi:ankyrin repeat protein